MSSSGDGVAPMELEGDENEHAPSVKAERRARHQAAEAPPPPDAADPPAEEAEPAGPAHGEGSEAVDDDEEEDALVERADRKRAKELKKKQKTRHQLKVFNDALDRPELQSAFLKQNSKGLRTAADKLDAISADIGEKDVSNSLLDASGFSKLGTFGQRQAQQLTSTIKIDTDEMVAQMQARFGVPTEDGAARGGGVDIDWYAFGRATSHYWRSVFVTSFMKGILGLQAEVKERKAAKRRAKATSDDDEPVAVAEQLRDTSKEAESMTDKRVILLFHHLPTEPTSFFDVLIHPSSFTQSVENIFDLTFLVKKGQAEVALDPELGIPTVRRIGDQEFIAEAEDEDGEGSERQSGGGGGNATSFQCIMRMDTDTWSRIVTAFDLTGRKPFLPDRAENYANADKWADHADRPASSVSGGTNKRRSGAASGTPSSAKRRAPEISAREKIGAHFTPSQPTLRDHIAPQSAHKKARPNDQEEPSEEVGDEDED